MAGFAFPASINIARRWRHLAVVALLVAGGMVGGCGRAGPRTGAQAPAVVGAPEQALVVAGAPRFYRLHVPPGAPAHARPAVVVLTGFLQPTADLESVTGWDTLADREQAVVVYPEPVATSWDAGSCCGLAAAQHVDDLAFLHAVIADLARRGVADPAQVFLTGFSNGAMLVYRVACQEPALARAYGIVGGSRQTSDCTPRTAVDLTVVHGDADPTVPLGGQPASELLRTGTASVRDSLTPFLADPSCPPGLPAQPAPGTTTVTCRSGTTLTLRIVPGLTHHWPTSADHLDATTYLWRQWHRRR